MEQNIGLLKNQLPVTYPFITSYPFFANVLSIISNHEVSMPWFYNYYINLEVERSLTHGVRLDFFQSSIWEYCPWIIHNKVPRNLVCNKWNSFVDFVIECIDLGFYIYCVVDEFYIPEYRMFSKQHVMHDIMIFGYNKQNHSVDIADFFKDGQYSYARASFSEIEQAFHNGNDFFDGIQLLKYRESFPYEFDISIIKEDIQDYLQCTNLQQKFKYPYQQQKKELGIWHRGI